MTSENTPTFRDVTFEDDLESVAQPHADMAAVSDFNEVNDEERLRQLDFLIARRRPEIPSIRAVARLDGQATQAAFEALGADYNIVIDGYAANGWTWVTEEHELEMGALEAEVRDRLEAAQDLPPAPWDIVAALCAWADIRRSATQDFIDWIERNRDYHDAIARLGVKLDAIRYGQGRGDLGHEIRPLDFAAWASLQPYSFPQAIRSLEGYVAPRSRAFKAEEAVQAYRQWTKLQDQVARLERTNDAKDKTIAKIKNINSKYRSMKAEHTAAALLLSLINAVDAQDERPASVAEAVKALWRSAGAHHYEGFSTQNVWNALKRGAELMVSSGADPELLKRAQKPSLKKAGAMEDMRDQTAVAAE